MSEHPHPTDPAPTEAPRSIALHPAVRPGAIIAWIVVLGMALFLAVLQNVGAPGDEPDPVDVLLPEPQDVSGFMGRYMGRAALMQRSLGMNSAASTFGGDPVEQITESVGDSFVEQLRITPAVGELAGAEATLEHLDGLRERLSEIEAELEADNAFDEAARQRVLDYGEDLTTLRAIYAQTEDAPITIDDAQRDNIIDRHGWSAELALTFGLDDDDPARAPFIAQGQRMLIALGVALLVVGLALITGFVLFIIGIVMLSKGRLKSAYRELVGPRVQQGGSTHSAFLEAFALFIVALLLLPIVDMALGSPLGPHVLWFSLALLAWPIVRGVPMRDTLRGFGWTPGRNVFIEVGAGFVGYIAGLPLVLVGLLTTVILMALSTWLLPGDGAPPSHPAVEQLVGGSGLPWGTLILGVAWAPIVEETFFRGALQHHLRQRFGFLFSAVSIAVIFAMIHPQGWVAIPALSSLAIVFSLLREWRGSIIAPIVAHAINNGFIFTMLIFAMG
ncbi:MAG: type II CAAX endopeptidase family protein [Planctomycetota bacterium]